MLLGRELEVQFAEGDRKSKPLFFDEAVAKGRCSC